MVAEVGELEFNVPFQHKYGYVRDEMVAGDMAIDDMWPLVAML